MKQRCLNPKAHAYERYGGRGIRICQAWLSFVNFFTDMGERPEGCTLERLDNSGNYEPGNCVWASRAVQGRNKRSTKLTLEKARSIRARLALGETQQKLATEFGCSVSNIWWVKANRVWLETISDLNDDQITDKSQ